jgi:uncharacterized protein (TIGR02246 family)
MMRTTLRLLVATLVVWTAPALADDVRAAIEGANATFMKTFLAGDANGVANLYTEDAQVIAPGAPVAEGREAIAAVWKQTIDGGVKDLTLTTLDVVSAGDVAGERGTVKLVGADGKAMEARYVVVWKRVDGTWKLHRDIWNAE